MARHAELWGHLRGRQALIGSIRRLGLTRGVTDGPTTFTALTTAKRQSSTH